MREKKWWLLAVSAAVALSGVVVLLFRHGRQEYLHTAGWYFQRRREYLQTAEFYAQKRMSYWNYKNSIRKDVEAVRRPYRCIACQWCRQHLPKGSVNWYCSGCPLTQQCEERKESENE